RGFRRSCRGSVVALPLALNLILIFAETARAARCARPPHPPSAPSPVNGGRAPTQAGGGSLQLSRKWGKGLRFERKKGARFTVRPVQSADAERMVRPTRRMDRRASARRRAGDLRDRVLRR